jgi:hypothetical protein
MNAQKLQSSVEGAGQFHLLVEDGNYQIIATAIHIWVFTALGLVP